jgi:hypothetical protein
MKLRRITEHEVEQHENTFLSDCHERERTEMLGYIVGHLSPGIRCESAQELAKGCSILVRRADGFVVANELLGEVFTKITVLFGYSMASEAIV